MPDPTAPIVDAIENLLNEVETLFDKVHEQIQTATYAGDYARITEIAQDAQALRPYREGLRAARNALKELVVPAVLSRVVSQSRTQRVPIVRAVRREGKARSRHAYAIPILQVLADLGGRGRITEVKQRVHDLVSHELTPYDYEELPNSPGRIRWEHRVAWARVHLRIQGLLEPKVQQGIWEISAAGRDFLDKARGLDEDDDDPDEIVQEGQA